MKTPLNTLWISFCKNCTNQYTYSLEDFSWAQFRRPQLWLIILPGWSQVKSYYLIRDNIVSTLNHTFLDIKDIYFLIGKHKKG